MIGLSVSQCFADMASGRMNPANVEKVISHTAASTPAHWEWIIQSNRSKQWARTGHPERAEDLFRKFLAEGRISQPRITGSHLPNVPRSGIWVDNEKEVVWK